MNRLPGTITGVEAAGGIALVDVAVDERRYTAMMVASGEEAAAWSIGMQAVLLFQETEVSLARELSGQISMRNRLPGTVTAIERGRLLTKVSLDVDGHAIGAVITTRSCDGLRLAVGDAVEGLVKANEMSLQVERGA
jgi:molybdate transport system regulatory protein